MRAVIITPEGTQETLKPSTHLWVGVFVYLLVRLFVWQASRKSQSRHQESQRAPITDGTKAARWREGRLPLDSRRVFRVFALFYYTDDFSYRSHEAEENGV